MINILRTDLIGCLQCLLLFCVSETIIMAATQKVTNHKDALSLGGFWLFFSLSFWTPTNYRHEKDEKLSWEFRSKTPDDVSLTLFPMQNFIPNQLLRGRKAALEKQREEKRRGALSRGVPEDSGGIVWPDKRHKRQPKSVLGFFF